MTGQADLLLFAHLMSRAEDKLDVEYLALLLAEPEHPGLDIQSYIDKLNVMGELARIKLRFFPQCGPAPADRITPILRLLYGELGFRGNVTDYYDPQNSFLNHVIDRRTGNPLSLAVVFSAFAGARAFRPTACLSLAISSCEPPRPRARWPPSIPLMAACSRRGFCNRFRSATGDPGDIDEQYLAPASRRQVVLRMLNNLRSIYELRGDQERLRFVLERMALLNPSEEVQRRLDSVVHAVALAPRISIN